MRRFLLFLIPFTLIYFPIIGISQNQYSLDFDQAQYVRIPISSTLSGLNEFTMEFWYYQTGSTAYDENIVGIEDSESSNFFINNLIQ